MFLCCNKLRFYTSVSIHQWKRTIYTYKNVWRSVTANLQHQADTIKQQLQKLQKLQMLKNIKLKREAEHWQLERPVNTFFLSPPGHRTTVEEAWHLCRRQPQCFWRLSHSRNTQLTHHTEVPTIHIRFLIKCTLYAGHCHWRGENYLSYIRLKSSHVKGELLTEAQNLYTLQVNFLFKQFHNLNSIFSCSPFESLSISQEYTGTKQFFTCFSVSFRAEHDYSSK